MWIGKKELDALRKRLKDEKFELIDVVEIHDRGKALFVEVKWRDLNERDVDRLLRELREKAKKVGLNGYKKYYGILAKKS